MFVTEMHFTYGSEI